MTLPVVVTLLVMVTLLLQVTLLVMLTLELMLVLLMLMMWLVAGLVVGRLEGLAGVGEGAHQLLVFGVVGPQGLVVHGLRAWLGRGHRLAWAGLRERVGLGRDHAFDIIACPPDATFTDAQTGVRSATMPHLSLIHISEPTRR